MTRTASTTEEKTSGSDSSDELKFLWRSWVTRNKFIFYCQTAELQGAKGGSCANATGKASSSGELKFCGEDGWEGK